MRAEALIAETLKLEETRFRATLERGLALLEEETRALAPGAKLAGEVAFKLYDTYGFPLDLTQDALRARGMGVDDAGFDAAMERQRAEARKAWAGSGEAATETVWFALRERVGATEFLGYETETAEGVVDARSCATAPRSARSARGERGWLVLNQTPFYGESGGQVGDIGRDARRPALRLARDRHPEEARRPVRPRGRGRGGDAARSARRWRCGSTTTRARRSAPTIRRRICCTRRCGSVLGDHVAQKGSLVAPDRLRFDITHPKPITATELAAVEDNANASSSRTRRSSPG